MLSGRKSTGTARTHISTERVDVSIGSTEDIEHVRAAARCAKRQGGLLHVTVVYRRPPAKTLSRWRAAAPEELHWRIHGTTVPESVTRTAIEAAVALGVVPTVSWQELEP